MYSIFLYFILLVGTLAATLFLYFALLKIKLI